MKYGLLFSFDNGPPQKKIHYFGVNIVRLVGILLKCWQNENLSITLVRHNEAITNLKQRSTGHSNCVSHN